MGFTAAGFIGATLTVAATTADDAIWLIPYLSGPNGWLHGVLFVATLETLVIVCVLASRALVAIVSEEWILSAIGAALCWLIAIGLFVKKWLKKRRRLQSQQTDPSSQREDVESSTPTDSLTQHNYGALDEALSTEAKTKDAMPFSPLTVVSLTSLGALDELSYFPALLLGGVFTPYDLCLGTAMAALLILAVVTSCLTRCQPLLDCLDSIPLYAVVGLFAAILTVETLFDFLTNDEH